MTYKHINPQYKKGISTSRKELTDLVKAWLLLGIAFAIAISGLKFSSLFFVTLFVSLFTVGIGFLFHELAHKFVAQKYGCFAEFRSFDKMLLLALLFSLVGFIFAAPGAVMIKGRLTKEQNGRISAAGPGMNLAVAMFFLSLAINSSGIWQTIGNYGFTINSWLALFNMIPVAIFDGRKILAWNKVVYGSMVVVALLFVFGKGLFL